MEYFNENMSEYFLYELYMAEQCLLDIIPVDSYQEIFEAENPNVKANIENNEKQKEGVFGHLKNACNALIKMIGQMLTKIKEFFFGSNKKKAAEMTEAYKKAVTVNPNIKNKKILCFDSGKFDAASAPIFNAINDADKKLANGIDVDTNPIVNKITEFCKSTGGAFATAMTVEMALNVASSSSELAKDMYNELKKNQTIQEEIAKKIGEGQYKKFEKDLKAMSKRVSLRHEMLKLMGYKSKSLEDGVQKTYENISSIVGSVVNVAKNAISHEVDHSKGKLANGISLASDLISKGGVGDVKKALKAHGGRVLSNVTGSEDAKKLIKTASGVIGDVTEISNQLHKDKVNKEKAEAKREKEAVKAAKQYRKDVKKDVSNQSKLDAILGTHDSNSKIKKSGVGDVVRAIV